MRRKLLDADDLINPGDIFKTNRKYEGERKEELVLIEVCDDVFINGDSTYFFESTKDGKRFYMGRSWVSKVKPTIKHKE